MNTAIQPSTHPYSAAVAAAAATAFEHGVLDEAVARAGEALRLDPDNTQALQLLALIDAQQGQPESAVALLERCVRLAPQVAQFHYNLAVTLQQVGADRESMVEYAATLRMEPDHVGALWNYGNLLRLDERFDAALPLFERLHELAPDYPGLKLAIAITNYGLRRLDQSERWFRLAAKYDARDPIVWWEMAHCLLTRGEWGEGFDCYDRRFEGAAKNGVYAYPFPFPLWKGESLRGRSILVHGEQGLGDEIMFAHVIPELIEEAERVVIATSPALQRLFAQSFPRAEVFAQARLTDNVWLSTPPVWLPRMGHMDFQVPIGNLGAIRRRGVDSFGLTRGYLSWDKARAARWRAYLDAMAPEASGALRVGLMWGANPSKHDSKGSRRAIKKSIPAQLLERLANVDHCAFVSLQNRDAAVDASRAPLLPVIDCHREIVDLADTAALVGAVDVVLSVDTSVLHMAGALGRETLGLLAWDCDFRWGHAGEETPWYPSVRLLRQKTPGDWAPVLDRAREEIVSLAAAKKAKS